MKTLKIKEETHKMLLKLKAIYGYKTLDKTIEKCIAAFCCLDEHRRLYEELKK